nr:zinc finger protein [Martellivirales sp.]
MALENLSEALKPGDSASNLSPNGSFVGSIAPELSKCVFTAEDYLRVVELLGVAEANDMRAFMSRQLDTVKQCLSIGAYSARVSSVGSGVSSPSSRHSGSLPSSRGFAAGLHGARTRSVPLSSKRVKRVPDGLCYTKLFNDSNVAHQAELLGKWPTLASLLKKPAAAFQSIGELSRFRLVGDVDAVHVRAGGVDGQSFLDSLGPVVASTRQQPGSFGAVVKSLGSTARVPTRLSLRTVVGGRFYCQLCSVPFSGEAEFREHCQNSQRHRGADGSVCWSIQSIVATYLNPRLSECSLPRVHGVRFGSIGDSSREFSTNAIGEANCSRCNHRWKSFAVPVKFRMRGNGVSLFVWRQECKRCRRECLPSLDYDDLTSKLVRRVRLWSGHVLSPVSHASVSTGPHKFDLCVAGRKGECTLCLGRSPIDLAVEGLDRLSL